MSNQITVLESCWHSSSPWGQSMPPLAVQIQEKVFLPNLNLSGYCCGVQWSGQQWIYAIVSNHIRLYLYSEEFHTTNLFEDSNVPTPAFWLGDVVEANISEQPSRRIIQGVFRLKDNWLYGVESRSPILEQSALSQSQFVWLTDIDLVR
ncbi:DUF1392 family protein [Nostoc sp. UHCC 0302]|uniref:DUF1392 family protein n=1 Tax=Nostoc sp. UHCC 0302 TaxID=3134896 RepID=UPI00311C95B7